MGFTSIVLRGSEPSGEANGSNPVVCTVSSPAIRQTETGMTSRQIRFARTLVNLDAPVSRVDAYRKTYKYQGGRNGLYVEATRLAQHPKIVLLMDAIRQAQAAADTANWHDRESLRQKITSELFAIAESAKSERVRLSALMAIGKLPWIGAFVKPRRS